MHLVIKKYYLYLGVVFSLIQIGSWLYFYNKNKGRSFDQDKKEPFVGNITAPQNTENTYQNFTISKEV
jgi:hypothetical protein